MAYSTGNSTLTGRPGKNGKAESEVSPSAPWPVGVRVDLPVQEAKCCQQALASNALQFERKFFFCLPVKPGERYREIGNIIQKHVQAHGYSVVRSYCGHGIHE